MSRSEDLAEESLRLVLFDDVEVVRGHRPDWLTNPKTGKRLELDLYLPRSNLAFEVQGPHHFDDPYQRYKDLVKAEAAEANRVTLIPLSIFQIDPFGFFRKLLSHSKKTGAFVGLKPIGVWRTAWERQREKVAEYRNSIRFVYGDGHQCQKPACTWNREESDARRSAIDAHIRLNPVFRVRKKKETLDVRLLNEEPDGVLVVRMLSAPGHTFRIGKKFVQVPT